MQKWKEEVEKGGGEGRMRKAWTGEEREITVGKEKEGSGTR